MSVYKNGLSVKDPKWAHPEIRPMWTGEDEGTSSAMFNDIIADDSRPAKERQEQIDQIFMQFFQGVQMDPDVDKQVYTVPGCPEEPETETEVWVYKNKNRTSKEPQRVYFSCTGGGLRTCMPQTLPNNVYMKKYDCTVVMPIFRTSLLGKYPAQINDCHAAYKWMVDNAEKLNIDPDQVVIGGASSGGHLALSLPFRLMKYGYSPRGVVVCNPLSDDRQLYAGARLRDIQWSGEEYRKVCRDFLGDRYNDPLLPPEAFANRATVEDCVGYPPLFVHTAEFDPGRDDVRDFYGKVLAAGTFAEFHCWAGVDHGIEDSGPVMVGPLKDRIQSIIEGNMKDCFQYDLRRPWVKDLAKKAK